MSSQPFLLDDSFDSVFDNSFDDIYKPFDNVSDKNGEKLNNANAMHYFNLSHE